MHTPQLRVGWRFDMRDRARLLGDVPEQTRQSAIVQRAVTALASREQVLAFRQLELVYEAGGNWFEGTARG